MTKKHMNRWINLINNQRKANQSNTEIPLLVPFRLTKILKINKTNVSVT